MPGQPQAQVLVVEEERLSETPLQQANQAHVWAAATNVPKPTPPKPHEPPSKRVGGGFVRSKR